MPETVTIHDKSFKIYLSEDQIKERIESISEAVNAENQNETPLFIVILNGAFLFATELIKRYAGACQIEFISIKSYEGMHSTGKVSLGSLDSIEVGGQDVIIVEDIVDSGKTLHEFLPALYALQPKSVKIASLLLKPKSLKFPIKVDYCGFEIPDEFVVGFGLDYDGLGRNLRDIYQVID